MKENSFDFDSVGKRMPYKVPEGFFDNNRKDIISKINQCQRNKGRKAMRIRLVRMAVAASLAALMVASFALYFTEDTKDDKMAGNSITTVYDYTDDDADWSSFAEADIFMEEY